MQPDDGVKKCPSCGTLKSLDDFPRHKGNRDGRATYCKPCHNRRNRESVKRNGGARRYHMRGRYGIDLPEIAKMQEAQGGLCAICMRKPAAQVDHSHRSSEVRGMLCDGCNGGLGAFYDNEQLLQKAIEYLERFEGSK